LDELGVDLGPAVAGDLEAGRGGDAEVVEDGADEAAIPEEGLGREIIYAEGHAELDIGDGLVKGEISGKEGNEDIASGPILDV
jgi:hypothetical protein